MGKELKFIRLVPNDPKSLFFDLVLQFNNPLHTYESAGITEGILTAVPPFKGASGAVPGCITGTSSKSKVKTNISHNNLKVDMVLNLHKLTRSTE
jgi:hypothetical protein